MFELIILICFFTVANCECYYTFFPLTDERLGVLKKPGDALYHIHKRLFSEATDECSSRVSRLINIEKGKYERLSACFNETKGATHYFWTAAKAVNGKWQWQSGNPVEGKWCGGNTANENKRVVISGIRGEHSCFKVVDKNEIHSPLCEYYWNSTEVKVVKFNASEKASPYWEGYALLVNF